MRSFSGFRVTNMRPLLVPLTKATTFSHRRILLHDRGDDLHLRIQRLEGDVLFRLHPAGDAAGVLLGKEALGHSMNSTTLSAMISSVTISAMP